MIDIAALVENQQALTEKYQNTRFHKSSRSQGDSNCVTVGVADDGRVAVRDTKLGPNSPTLEFTASEWAAFKEGVLRGEF
ncbi:DUF397 domain-containing protein [Actinoplanes siamensis]|uniref:DUF397 domain-containing protein n=1 Tax=Actinoplanes siamensis TaxID=1223317 RepID=A0A919NC25_9ACTN|nr:DUF397 domain-containing protein [Actinoplanes siamensis]GIF08383.1 hypothetical protein Asi03nite_59210 [Actinoplanes siamensis]